MPSIAGLDRDGHRRRLENLKWAEQSVRSCLRRHLITDYIPGQVTYNLGEYPWVTPYDVDEADEQRLQWYASHGVRLVQLHEEWNDSQRLYGGDKFTPSRPEALGRFVEMAHACGMKVLLYASTGFFERTDPDFDPAWADERDDLVEIYFRYARCSPASPGWRAYVLPRLERIMDAYGVDGLYDDLGSMPPRPESPESDTVAAFEQTPAYSGALEDLLGLVYAMVKARGGIFKVHCDAKAAPPVRERVYDYLWVGEGVSGLDDMRETAKHHRPYVCPCYDLSRAQPETDDELFLHSLPYMQFPLIVGGKPITGERAVAPAARYTENPDDFWTGHVLRIREQYLAHPQGPHTYGWWDAVPGRPGLQAHLLGWLERYAPMVQEGAVAYIEVGDSDLFEEPLPAGVIATLYVREEAYLVLANYGQTPVTVRTRDEYAADGPTAREWRVEGRGMALLRRTGGGTA